MSLYHMVHGVTPATFFVLPMLGYHPDEYPRFRDCFVRDEEHPDYDGYIHVYTRVGGGNRADYEKEIEALRQMPGYITDFDDLQDSTYASFIFAVPDKWKQDFELLMEGRIMDTSPEYKELVRRIYPQLDEKLRQVFAEDTDESAETDDE